MSKYFAKYLPVEGKVKPKDKFKHGINGRYLAIASDGWNEQSKIFFPEYFKVKLFLCSRDIKVGDKFKSPLYPDKEYECLEKPDPTPQGVYPDKCYYTKNRLWFQWIPYSEGYKVIGLISKQAVWVTEGMEFDESDLRMLIKGNTTDWEFDPTYPTEKYPLKHILVKGPCGHFH